MSFHNTHYNHRLPAANALQWAHAVSSQQELRNIILNQPNINAIETDILMGHEISSSSSSSKGNGNNFGYCKSNRNNTNSNDFVEELLVPIHAHPPDRQSDLTNETFFQIIFHPDLNCNAHLKLDFKELNTVKPVLQNLLRYNGSYVRNNNNHDQKIDATKRCVYLNADILPGPGKRNEALSIQPDDFLQACCSVLTTDVLREHRYIDNDVQAMIDLIQKYRCSAFDNAGIVLALNARQLAKNLDPFVRFLEEVENSQLLVWTGTGEPAISHQQLKGIQKYYNTYEKEGRIGFDCRICPNILSGILNDYGVWFVGIYWNLFVKK